MCATACWNECLLLLLLTSQTRQNSTGNFHNTKASLG